MDNTQLGSNEPVRLTFISGPLEGRDFLIEDELSVGKDQADVCLDEDDISAIHCIFRNRGGVVLLTDQGSLKGTYLSDQKLSPKRTVIVDKSDLIRIGETQAKIDMSKRTEVQSFNARALTPPPNIPDEQFVSSEAYSYQELNEQEDEDPPPIPKDLMESKIDKPRLIVKRINRKQSKLSDSKSDNTKIPESHDLEIVELSPVETHKVLTEKTSAFHKQELDIPGFFTRFAALCMDFSIAYMSQLLIYEWQSFQHITALISNMLIDFTGQFSLKILTKLAFTVQGAIPSIVCFIGLGLLANALLGVSFGQYFIGVRSVGGFVKVRILAPIRFLIGLCSLPLILLDIPAVANMRTFKELVTMTPFYVAHPWLRFVGIAMLAPIITLLAFLMPLLQSDFFWQNHNFVDYRVNNHQEKIPQVVKQQYSRQFKANFPVVDNSSFILLPALKLTQIADKKRVTTQLQAIDTKNSTLISLSVSKGADLYQLASIRAKRDPLLRFTHPSVQDYVGQREKNQHIFSEKASLDYIAMVRETFKLDRSNLWDYLWSNGPFFSGVINFRAQLSKLLGPSMAYSLEKLSGNDFLVAKKYKTKEVTKRYLSLNHQNPLLISVKLNGDHSTESLRQFESEFLHHSQWDFDDEIKLSKSLDLGNGKQIVYQAVDFMLNLELLGDDRSTFFEGLYNYYYTQAREVLKGGHPSDIRGHYLTNLKGLIQNARLVYQKHATKDERNFLAKMSLLESAFKSEDVNFFNLREQ